MNEIQDKGETLKDQVNVFVPLVHDLLAAKPVDHLSFMIDWLKRRQSLKVNYFSIHRSILIFL